MIVIYNILFFVGFILYFPILLFRGKVHGGFIERLGFLSTETRYQLSQKSNIWVHAVSVGEVLAVLGLLERLRLKHKDKRIIVTTVTTTGFQLARKRLPKEDFVLFAPLDFSWAVRAYLKAINPQMYVTAETELWPNLLSGLNTRDVPVAMVNGRISTKSFYRYRKFAFFFRKFLRPIRIFCMQSNLDADRIIAMGALPKNVMVAGSMKFDAEAPTETIDRARLGLTEDDLIWVAGSTHPGEEKILLEIFKKLKPKFPNLALVLAARHIERSKEVGQLVTSHGFSPAYYSKITSESVDPGSVVVLDTIGHLKAFYRLASVVFVGKSLVGEGGQNPIEPAILGKPVVFGPNMQNFKDIADIFIESKSVIQVQDAAELQTAVERLLSDPQYRQILGSRAENTVRKNQGATARTEKLLSTILRNTSFLKPV